MIPKLKARNKSSASLPVYGQKDNTRTKNDINETFMKKNIHFHPMILYSIISDCLTFNSIVSQPAVLSRNFQICSCSRNLNIYRTLIKASHIALNDDDDHS